MVKSFNEDQITAIKHNKGPVLVLGTPGSGKTTVIVERIRCLVEEYNVKPSGILVITFTRAAAESMKERFLSLQEGDKSDVRFGTFHSFFFWILKTAYGYDNSSILSEENRRKLIREIITSLRQDFEVSDELVTSIIHQIELVDCDMIEIENYYSQDLPDSMFREIYHRFRKEKERRGLIDFDDMMSLTYRLLKERPDILERIRYMYPYIMIDEFQDTNLLQFEIVKLLSAPLNNLFVVGDDDQSIYGFRGARPDIMLSFKKYYENADIITLKTNYRCPADVTLLSGKLIKNNKKRYDKNLRSASSESGTVLIQEVRDTNTENLLIVKRIREAMESGISPDDIAVLYRTNRSPRRLIYKLREYNIPFVARDTVPDIFSDQNVSVIMDYMYFASGDTSRKRFLNFMNKPVRYIPRNLLTSEKINIHELIRNTKDRDYLQSNLMLLRNQLESISRLTPYAAVNYIRKMAGYDEFIKKYSEERNIDKDEIFDIIDEFQSITKNFETFPELFGYADDEKRLLLEEKKRNEAADRGKPVVQLMTMHSAKGLEFKEVHIIDCVEGEIPHRRSRAAAQLEEERRMFYVAMTRSMDKLYIYAPAKISDKPVRVSRFIKEAVK